MASNKDYLTFVLEQLSDLDDISYRAMMGEYILYFRGKIIGGIYDDRLLVKPVQSAISLMPTATYELPYEGAKEMLLVVAQPPINHTLTHKPLDYKNNGSYTTVIKLLSKDFSNYCKPA